jgi:NADH-quinone oxidoreductase subunit J
MTTRPRLHVGGHLWRGVAALGLFAVMAAAFVTAGYGDPVGFADVDSITAAIGYAMFDVPHESVQSTGTESFLVAFIVIAIVLDAALEGAVMLARREGEGDVISALRTLGGED